MSFPKVSGELILAAVASRPRLATDVAGAVVYTVQSRAQLYKDMRAGLLPAYKNGARTVLFFDDLDRYMRSLPRATFKPLLNDDDAGAEREAAAAEVPTAETVGTAVGLVGRLAEAKRRVAKFQKGIVGTEADKPPE